LRPFLAFLAILFAALAAAPAAAERIALSGTGLSIERPAQWETASLDRNLDNADRARMGDERFRDRARQAMAGIPFLSFTRRAVNPVFMPTVRVQVRPDTPATAGLTAPHMLEATFDLLSRQIGGVRLIEGPVASARFGAGGSVLRLAYPMTTSAGQMEVRSHIWLVKREARIYSFSVTMAADEPEATWQDADAILDTVTITPPAPERGAAEG
jgi:hypothetical protein